MKCGSPLRTCLVLLIVIAFGFGTNPGQLFAQAGAPAGGKQLPRPQAQPLRVAAVPPQLQAVLEKWSKASARVTTLQGKHRRWVYDSTFQVEKRSNGVFYYENPDKGRIDIEGADIAANAVAGRKGINGKPFQLQTDRSEKWICTGSEILSVNEADKTVEMFPIPPDSRGKNIINGPLPFLFGLPPEQAKMRYQLKLLRETAGEVWIAAKPRWKQDAVNYRDATIILDKSNYLPKAVKLVDPPGTTETVFAFYDFEINKKKPGILGGIFGSGDPFKPKLKDYRLITNKPEVGKANGTPSGNANREKKTSSRLLPRLPLRR